MGRSTIIKFKHMREITSDFSESGNNRAVVNGKYGKSGRKWVYRIILCLTLLLLVAHEGVGQSVRTWFVSTSGADANPGSRTLPLRRIQDAVGRAQSGDTVLILPGLYKENVSVVSKNLILTSQHIFTNDKLDISGTIIDGDSVATALTLQNFNGVVNGLTIQRGFSPFGAGLKVISSNTPVVRNCIIQRNTGYGDITCHGVLFEATSGLLEKCIIRNNYGRKHTVQIGGNSVFRNSEVYNNTANEETNVSVNSAVQLYNLLIHHNQGGGLKVWPGGAGAKISNLTIYDNTSFGLLVWGLNTSQDTRGVISNSIIWGNDTNIVLRQSGTPAKAILDIDYCIVEGGKEAVETNAYLILNYGPHNSSADPLVINPQSDLGLQAGSPALGAGRDSLRLGGQTIYLAATDYFGRTRPSPAGSWPDIGAIESELRGVVAYERLASFAWMAGSKTPDQTGSSGQPGLPSADNIPGSRIDAASWSNGRNDVWIFGGNGFSLNRTLGYLNDLWRFDPSAGTWALEKGTDQANLSGTYGVKGISSSTNLPGGRGASSSCIDPAGNLWLFGGGGYDKNGTLIRLNDLWKYNPATTEWTWVSGSETGGASGVYGQLGVASASNAPGARDYNSLWCDNSGKIWLFGGRGFDKNGTESTLNDLWRFDPASGQWTWMAGSDQVQQQGVYGTRGVASPETRPGARWGSIAWYDKQDNLWLYSGWAYANDVWKYSIATGQWTWMAGQIAPNYGEVGVARPDNMPGERSLAMTWSDKDGNLLMYGGNGNDKLGNYGPLSDFWKFDVKTTNWVWLGGRDRIAEPASYGSLKISSASNLPGGRYLAAPFSDNSGNLWMFGGEAYNDNGAKGKMNDLWKISFSYTSNTPPRDILLSKSSVLEKQPVGTVIGTFTQTDTEGGAYVTSLVTGPGADDNAFFTVSGNSLKTAVSFLYAQKEYYSIRVRVVDDGGLSFDKVLGIYILPAYMANGRSYYVSTTGLDSNPGTRNFPLRRIQTGINFAVNGDSVLVMRGKYLENVRVIDKNITLSSLHLFTADPGDIAQTIVDGDSITNALVLGNFNGLLNGFTIQRGLSNSGAGLKVVSSNTPVVRNCIVQRNYGYGDITGHGIIFSASNGILENCIVRKNYGRKHTVQIDGRSVFRNSEVYDNTAWEESNVVVNSSAQLYNLLIYNNKGGGVKVWPGASGAFLSNLTIYGNTGFGLLIWGLNTSNTTSGVISNSIIWGNEKNVLLWQSSTAKTMLDIDYCIVQGGQDGIQTGPALVLNYGAHNLSVDPGFRNPPLDFNLLPTSPAVGAGRDSLQLGSLTIYLPGNDYAGNSRPSPAGTRPDIGALEYVELSPKADQQITFQLPDSLNYITPFVRLTGSASSGLPVVYSSSDTGLAVVKGDTLQIRGAGIVTITADQPGNTGYFPAAPVAVTVSIAKASLQVKADDVSRPYNSENPPFSLTYSGFRVGEAASVLDASPMASTTAVKTSNPGTYPITVSGGADNNYSFVFQSGTLTVTKLTQAVAFTLPPVLYQDQSPYTLSATASSGGPVTFAVVSGQASVSGNLLTILGSGPVSVKAAQAGTAIYEPAETVASSVVAETYSVSGLITKPGNVPLGTGLAKLFYENGGLAASTSVTNGVYQITLVRSGRYILQVVPLGSEENNVFPAYYNSVQLSKDASVIVVNGNVTVSMEMPAKPAAPDKGPGEIRGKVVSGNAGGGRFIVGRIAEGTGLANVPVYLLENASDKVVRSVNTDKDGFFVMQEIPVGPYRLALDVVGASLSGSATSVSITAENPVLEVSAAVSENQSGAPVISLDVQVITGIREWGSVRVYPNPFIDDVTVRMDSDRSAPVQFRLYDMSGKLMGQQMLGFRQDGRYTLHLAQWCTSSGVYLLELNQTGRRLRIKVIR